MIDIDDVFNKITHRKLPFEVYLGPTVYVRNTDTNRVCLLDKGSKLRYSFSSWNFGRDAFFFKGSLVYLSQERTLVKFDLGKCVRGVNAEVEVLVRQSDPDPWSPRVETLQLIHNRAFMLFENGEIFSYNISTKKLSHSPHMHFQAFKPEEGLLPYFTTLGYDGKYLLASSVPDQPPCEKKDSSTVYLMDPSNCKVLSSFSVTYSNLYQSNRPLMQPRKETPSTPSRGGRGRTWFLPCASLTTWSCCRPTGGTCLL